MVQSPDGLEFGMPECNHCENVYIIGVLRDTTVTRLEIPLGSGPSMERLVVKPATKMGLSERDAKLWLRDNRQREPD